MSPTSSNPTPTNQAASASPQPPAQPTSSSKKKKKRKNTPSSASAPSQSEPHSPRSRQTQPLAEAITEQAPGASPTSASPSPATVEQWQQRLQNLRASLTKSQKDNQLLASDLSAALARASDAEQAEAAVNKGLLTARSVISQRDRTIAELKSTSSILRADLERLQEEKKKTDKRLVLLKTVSANLQEAREARDGAEKRLEEANAELARLKEVTARLETENAALQKSVEAMEMVKQQLARREIEIDELTQARERSEVEARRAEAKAVGVGAISVLLMGLIMRVVSGGRGKRKE